MSFWSFVTGTEDPAESKARYDASLAHYNATGPLKVQDGTISQERWDYLSAQANAVQLENSDDAAQAGFIEGAKDGLNNVLAAPGDAIGGGGSIVSKILGNIPWWFWIVAVGAVFLYLGGGVFLLRKGRGYFAR